MRESVFIETTIPSYHVARLDLLRDIPLLSINEQVAFVAEKIIRRGIIPARVADDALHISCAAVHGMDYLLTWNCRHIANPHNQRRIRETLGGLGYEVPVICTPEEFLENG